MSALAPPARATLPFKALAGAAAVLAVTSVVLLSGLAQTRFGWYYDDIGSAVTAAIAAVAAGSRCLRTQGRMRAVWLSMTAACTSYTIGQGIWCWYQLVRGVDPFPSIADVGYLGFPVFASVAILLYPTSRGSGSRGKLLLDTIMVTSSVALISWVTVLGTVSDSSGGSRLSVGVSLAYPITDIAVLVLTILTLSRLNGGRAPLLFMGAGVAVLAVSDSLFAALTATGTYNGGATDLGWFVAFLLLALAALVRDDRNRPTSAPANVMSARTMLLPYGPALLAIGVRVLFVAIGQQPKTGQLALTGVVIVTLLLRQYLTLRENLGLSSRLADREARLKHQAFHDDLTGLANRALFQDRLTHALQLHARDLRSIAVLFLDLDDFKIVNDTLGHAAGDRLLAHVAERLVGAARGGDTVARLGGDEFAVLIEDSGDAAVLAAKITDVMRAPFHIGNSQLRVTASIGVVVLDPADASATADMLVTRADTAMYAAKRGGKARIELYRDGMSLSEVEDTQYTEALLDGIRTGALRLDYQPVVNVATGEIATLEALARWTYRGTAVAPTTFIAHAVRTGVIAELTTHVLNEACSQISAWSRLVGHDGLAVAVNVPPGQLVTTEFTDAVATLIKLYAVAPGQLIIEITEDALFEDMDAARRAIDEMHQLGVRVYLDDFGVGYSSLARLHHLQLDAIKMDKSFVDHIDSDANQATLVEALIQLGRVLGLPIIAEGIERSNQLEALRGIGCEFAQGYLFARPTPPEGIPALLMDRGTSFAPPRGAQALSRT